VVRACARWASYFAHGGRSEDKDDEMPPLTPTEAYERTTNHIRTATELLDKNQKAAMAKAQKSLDKIKGTTAALEAHAHADLVGAALAGSGESIYAMVKAFRHGRNEEGGAEILRMVGQIAKLGFVLNKLTTAAGPIGIVLSELLSMAALFLGETGAEQASLKEQLKAELNEFGTKQHVDTLEGVMDQLEEIRGELLKLAELHPDSMSWESVSQRGRFTGQQAIELGSALSWMRREQAPEFWSTLFRTYLDVTVQRIQNLAFGLAAIKKSDGQGPTDDLKLALAVFDVMLRQADEALRVCGPMIPAHETRWFVGGNSSMYFCDYNNPGGKWEGTVGSRARRIAVGSEGERIWHIGTNRGVYTKTRDGSWKQLPNEEADDIVVVQVADSGADHVLTVKDGALRYRRWEEERAEDGGKKFAEDAEVPYKASGLPSKVHRIALTPDGVLYALAADDHRLWRAGEKAAGVVEAQPSIHDRSSWSTPRLVSVTANRERVYVCSSHALWSMRHEELADTGTPHWEMISWPSSAGAPVVSSTAGYTDLTTTIDGVVAIIDMKMYRWSEIQRTWSQVDGNTAQQLVVVPLKGWETFDALKATVENLRSTVDKLKTPA